MELTQARPKTHSWTWEGVTFHYRTEATVHDRFVLDTSGEMQKDGTLRFNTRAFVETLIGLFVTGWEGVTAGGQPVPYSLEDLKRLPISAGAELILKLGDEIHKHVDMFKKQGEPAKNV